MEFCIDEEFVAGYTKTRSLFSFACPLCDEMSIRNFDKGCVRDEVWRHLVVDHRILAKKIDMVILNDQALKGMEKVDLQHSGSGV